MNFYLLFLSIYSLCILPLTLQVELRLGKRFAYRLRVRITGMGLVKHRLKRANEEQDNSDRAFAVEAKEHDVKDVLSWINPALLRCLFSREVWQAVKRYVRCSGVWIRTRVAFEDAAVTAVTYGAVTALIDTLKRMDLPLSRLRVEAKASFSGEGGETVIVGILLVRLGSLALVASRFLARYQKARNESGGEAQTVVEENEHATAASDR